MTLKTGDRFPDATLVEPGPDGPRTVRLSERLSGRRVVLFGLPGAFTGTCSTAHMPSFVRTASEFRDRGVDEIICVSVNDPFVLQAWAAASGAADAGITLLGDADGALTRRLGMAFSAPAIGLIGRSNRYAVVLEDGIIMHANVDEPGVCDISRGEQLLEVL